MTFDIYSGPLDKAKKGDLLGLPFLHNEDLEVAALANNVRSIQLKKGIVRAITISAWAGTELAFMREQTSMPNLVLYRRNDLPQEPDGDVVFNENGFMRFVINAAPKKTIGKKLLFNQPLPLP